jgi:cytidine deaminase
LTSEIPQPEGELRAAAGASDLDDATRSRLLEVASGAAEKAYAPFSDFRVGAAVLDGSGRVSPGCNVENSSYGLTICAERNAIFGALTRRETPDFEVQVLAVVEATGRPAPPCGACRQVIYEHGPNATVVFHDEHGLVVKHITELLPHGFRLAPS